MAIKIPKGKALLLGAVSVLLVLVVACGTSAPATSVPQATSVTAPTAVPQATEVPSVSATSAKDRALAVIATEPENLFHMVTADAHTGQFTDTINAYIGHLDKNTLEVAPTSMLVSWEQTAPAEWVYNLRPGVTFHDGEPWNAEAWKVYAQFAGVTDFGVGAYAHTGPYQVEVIDDLTARVVCGEPCPLFSRGLNLSKTFSPQPLRDEDFYSITAGIGTGPYKVANWERGSKLVTEKFEDFVPAPETPEYAAPILNEIEWQWRGETTVRAAMIEAGEADWAFLITLEDAERLGSDNFVTGGTAEIAQFRIDTIWDPWLRIKEMRQAIVHSINCQDIVDSIYGGATTCRGNHGAPGVLGITTENIKPYEYDPDLSRKLLADIGYTCGLPNSRDDCEASIKLSSRAARIARNEELVESMVSFMSEAGINAEAQFLEVSIRTAMGRCGLGTGGAGGTQIGWQGATEAKEPVCEGGVGVGQILDGIGFGYEIMDFAKMVNRHMLCESGRSTVCVPEKEVEWATARTLDGEERRIALEKIADWQRENVYIIPMFDLFAVYGINSKLRGFEEPRFDKHMFANLWWFAE